MTRKVRVGVRGIIRVDANQLEISAMPAGVADGIGDLGVQSNREAYGRGCLRYQTLIHVNAMRRPGYADWAVAAQ